MALVKAKNPISDPDGNFLSLGFIKLKICQIILVSPICLPIHNDEIFQKSIYSFDSANVLGFTYTVPMKYSEGFTSLIPPDLCQLNYKDVKYRSILLDDIKVHIYNSSTLI